MTLRDYCKVQDAAWVAGWIDGRMMVSVPVETVARWLRTLSGWIAASDHCRDMASRISDGTCDLYLKAQMTKENLFQALHQGVLVEKLTVDLHVGFLSIHETEEELRRLRQRSKEDDEELLAWRLRHGIQASGMERTLLKLTPIDVTARRVAPVEPIK